MKKRAAMLLCACLCTVAGAEAQNTTYVFPYEGLRYTQRDDEVVLTQTNLNAHEALLSELGTTRDAVLANYVSSGIVMEVMDAQGGQIAVSAVEAQPFDGCGDIQQMDDAQKAAFVRQFVETGMYEEAELTDTQPICVRLVSSAMYGTMPVYSLRYVTLQNANLYTFHENIIGRSPMQEDDERMRAVLENVRFLSGMPEAKSEEETPQAGIVYLTDTAETGEPVAVLELEEPESYSFTGRSLLIKGKTEPNATVYLEGKGNKNSTKANKNGAFSIRVFMEGETTEVFTLRTNPDGFAENRAQITLSHALTYREAVNAFRQKMIEVEYEDILREPQAYAGKKFIFRGQVQTFMDYDGMPCALVCVSNRTTGVWKDPIWIILDRAEEIAEGDIVTFYLEGEGITLPADAAYTQSGSEVEAPVARCRFTADKK